MRVLAAIAATSTLAAAPSARRGLRARPPSLPRGLPDPSQGHLSRGFARRGAASAVVARLTREVGEALRGKVKEGLFRVEMEALDSSRGDFAAAILSETARMAERIGPAGLRWRG